VVVGADGVHSLVRRTLFPGRAFHPGLALAFQAEVPEERLRSDYRSPSPRIFLGEARWGYGWIFPRGDRRLVGMSGLIRKNPAFSARFRVFLKRVLADGRGAEADAAAAPAGNYLEKPGSGRVLLAGDAAGFADPLTGEGLYFAHRSAREAARIILEAPIGERGGGLASRYRLGLEPVYLDLKAGLRLRNLAYSGARRLGYLFAGSPWFFNRLAEGVHGIRRFSNLPLLTR
jgi:flavin-dependent dehydrogenase